MIKMFRLSHYMDHLIEPKAGQIEELISELKDFTKVKIKGNLKRLLGNE